MAGWLIVRPIETALFADYLQGSAILILVDFILATMPVQLIRTLQRAPREKILSSCLMAMGLIATGIAAYKMTLSQQVNTGDLLSTSVKLSGLSGAS
jgi:hypothetical protein